MDQGLRPLSTPDAPLAEISLSSPSLHLTPHTPLGAHGSVIRLISSSFVTNLPDLLSKLLDLSSLLTSRLDTLSVGESLKDKIKQPKNSQICSISSNNSHPLINCLPTIIVPPFEGNI